MLEGGGVASIELRMKGMSTARLGALAALGAACSRSALPIPYEADPCPGRSADCDGDPTNGCEADLANDASDCGACGNPCDDGAACSRGACVPESTLVDIEGMISTSFARTAGGDVYVWGNNEYGKGDPLSPEAFILRPKKLALPEPVVQVRVERLGTCARGQSGAVWCWGSTPVPGADEDAGKTDFVKVAAVYDARELTASQFGFCVIDAYRDEGCWSYNEWSELSTGSGHEVERPVAAPVEMSALPHPLISVFPNLAVVREGPERFPAAFLDEPAMEIRLLADHRTNLIAERTRGAEEGTTAT